MRDLYLGLCTHHVLLFLWQPWEIETVILPDFLDWKKKKKTRLKFSYLRGPMARTPPRSPRLSVMGLPSDLSTEHLTVLHRLLKAPQTSDTSFLKASECPGPMAALGDTSEDSFPQSPGGRGSHQSCEQP